MNFNSKFTPQKKNRLTTKPIQKLLPQFLKEFNQNCINRPDLVVTSWPQIIGERLSSMTRAESFKEGVLYVRVFNSTLLSILTHRERLNLLKKMKAKFPKTDINEIRFRLG